MEYCHNVLTRVIMVIAFPAYIGALHIKARAPLYPGNEKITKLNMVMKCQAFRLVHDNCMRFYADRFLF